MILQPHSRSISSREGELQRAMVASYKQAKDYQRLVFIVSYFSAVLAASSALDLPSSAVVIIFVAILALQVASHRFSRISRSAYSRGERFRREHRQFDALERNPAPRTLHDLPAPSEQLALGAVEEGRVYYNTSAPVGRKRLVDALAQSALQTELIAERGSQENCFLFFGLWVVSTLLIIVLSSPSVVTLTFHTHQAALALVAGLTLGPHLDAWLAYRDLYSAARECAGHFIALRGATSSNAMTEVERWMSTYDCALAAAPVLPDRLWKKTERIANEKWERISSG